MPCAPSGQETGSHRELALSAAVRANKLQEYVAFDQDEARLAVVAHDYVRLGRPHLARLRAADPGGKVQLGEYDFVCAAGLVDYLNNSAAKATTTQSLSCWRAKRPKLAGLARKVREARHVLRQ
jgi:hypothetical protein